MVAPLNLLNKRFGKLKAIKRAENSATGNARWLCKCDCGNTKIVIASNLTRGNSTSCGCSAFNNPKKIKDLKGQKFGKLTVLNLSRKRSSCGNVMWNCLCECGNKVRIRTASLNNGNTKSCGCLKINNISGENNYQARRMIEQCGTWIPSTDDWSMRASRIMSYSRRDKIPFGFKNVGEFIVYLKSIAPEICPVFKEKLVTGDGQSHDWSPSVDKIIPEKGYVRGNIQVISYLANKMKQDASPDRLIQFADWIYETFGHLVNKQNRDSINYLEAANA